jgi:hypothetical protein
MPVFVKFSVPKTTLNCIYDGEVDLEHWDAIKKAVASNELVLSFVHQPTLYGFEVKRSSMYDGSIDVEIISDGMVNISANGLAKIDGSAKAVKEVNLNDPDDFIFDGVVTDISDGFGGMSLSDDSDKSKASVIVSDKKI